MVREKMENYEGRVREDKRERLQVWLVRKRMKVN